MKSSNIFIFLMIIIFTVCGQEDSTRANTNADQEVAFILHGFARSKTAMVLLAARLENAGYLVHRISYPTLNTTPEEGLKAVSRQINTQLPDSTDIVHFVGHSLGGLMIRAYLQENRLPGLGHVVLIGTPNQGTPLADRFRDSWWFKLLGSMPVQLGTDSTDFPKSLEKPYYPVGIITGVLEGMENEKLLPGKDDGVVPATSTLVAGMTDRITINTGHAMLRYNKEVAEQTIEFLKNGKFRREINRNGNTR